MISALIISFAFLFANQTPEVYVKPVLIGTTTINDTPTYFFKPSPDGRYMGYTTWRATDGHDANKNILLDTMSGTFLQMPGAYDPMFMLNNRNIVVPGAGKGMRFFRLEDVLNQQAAAQPIFFDTEFKGVYESVGILSKSSSEINYRIVIENGKRFYRDYKETLDATGRTVSITPTSNVNSLCTNHSFALPMVSKNGLEVSGLDHTTGKSRIYALQPDQTCVVTEEIGYLAGKISFGYNPRYIAFHVFDRADSLGEFAFGHITVPTNTTTANIYIKDRLKQITYKLSNYVDGNAMYPDFLANGDLVYILYPHKSQTEKPRFVRIRPTIY